MGATATTEIDAEVGTDAQAVYERTLAINKELKDKEDDKVGVYHFFPKECAGRMCR